MDYALSGGASKKFFPQIISWNTTFKCNLKCDHCYINAHPKGEIEELSTEEGKALIDQIADVSKPTLILSGGEPLLRKDIFELAEYGVKKGLRTVMGTNGTLINDEIARKLRSVGVRKVAISLDSTVPERHDEFRGVKGAWEAAVRGINACRENGIELQINTTVTKQNYNEIGDIIALAQKLGATDFHLFFLVPTGRGVELTDISPIEYEKMMMAVIKNRANYKLEVKPTCAPQFMRIAKQMGVKSKRWVRGCIAGLWYCRIYPSGDVTPCPYLPIKVGNIREKSFKEIWFQSDVLNKLRDFNNLKGKCGICEYRDICGGCRARAYGLTTNYTDVCGGLQLPTSKLTGDYLAEEPWCIYRPGGKGS